eukprot:TRINITY_DN7971_c0_g1_i6.p1 TRINITY_DN7971_c0_g1~~TRINITY_DN7971_c0_g1_i6.p1  ORF type:complete len:293 (-),score=49.38 TRINITY_DN7971_c0_g1_i6:11-802(-)
MVDDDPSRDEPTEPGKVHNLLQQEVASPLLVSPRKKSPRKKSAAVRSFSQLINWDENLVDGLISERQESTERLEEDLKRLEDKERERVTTIASLEQDKNQAILEKGQFNQLMTEFRERETSYTATIADLNDKLSQHMSTIETLRNETKAAQKEANQAKEEANQAKEEANQAKEEANQAKQAALNHEKQLGDVRSTLAAAQVATAAAQAATAAAAAATAATQEEQVQQVSLLSNQLQERESKTKEIGRAVQQECRDRSRMPSSA